LPKNKNPKGPCWVLPANPPDLFQTASWKKSYSKMVSAKGANEMCKNARSLRGPNIYVEMTSASRHSKTWQPALLSLKGVLNTMKPAELTKNARLFSRVRDYKIPVTQIKYPLLS